MKFITFKYDNKEQVGILTKNEQGSLSNKNSWYKL